MVIVLGAIAAMKFFFQKKKKKKMTSTLTRYFFERLPKSRPSMVHSNLHLIADSHGLVFNLFIDPGQPFPITRCFNLHGLDTIYNLTLSKKLLSSLSKPRAK